MPRIRLHSPPQPPARHSARIGAVALLLAVCLQPAAAKLPTVELSALHQGERHELALRVVNRILDNYHYVKFDLDDEMSRQILKTYVEGLDHNRYYFTAQDIARFDRYQTTLDDAIKNVDIQAAFDIFLAYRARVEELSAYAGGLLERDFDFTVDEEFLFDRRETPWAEDLAALKAVWQKRVKNDVLNLRLTDKEPGEIKETLRKRYAQIGATTRQFNSNDVFQSFVNAYTTSIEPHTAYFSPRNSENFDISMRLSLEGIGAVLRAKSDYTEIVRVVPGGPAALSGALHASDRIIGVAQDEDGEMIDVVGWRLDDVVDLIRGPKGTRLRLQVLSKKSGHAPPGRTIPLVRDKVKLEEQSADSTTIELPGRSIGVIGIPTFYIDFAAQSRGDKEYKSTTQDVRNLISELVEQDIDGLIIDLRGNGGGSLSEALELTGLFIDQGPVVQTKDVAGDVEVGADPIPGISYPGPLAVLVDKNSASASEIFAGAIQDYRRGIIVGEPTFGKGTVQNIIELDRYLRGSDESYGRLKATIAQFYRISGGSNQHKGVVPDIAFPLGTDYSEHGERAHENALPWDTVRPAHFVPANAPVARFAEAREKHARRIQQDELFQLFLQELELIRTNGERKRISLMRSGRKQDQERQKKARRDIQNRMRALVNLAPLPEDDSEEEKEESDANSEQVKKEKLALDILLKETARILDDLIPSEQRTRGAANDKDDKTGNISYQGQGH